MKEENYMIVAEQVYKYVNPATKMNTPNAAYIATEKWHKEWQITETDLDLFAWILENKQ